MAYETDDGVVCEQCGNEYSRIGSHWAKSSDCDYPKLSDLKKDIIVGSLMGDGWIRNKNRKNRSVVVAWSSKEQCSWLDRCFGWLSTGASLDKTGEEKKKNAIERDDNIISDDPDFSDVYCVRTRSHPFITSLTNDWYGDSGYKDKCWPADIKLTPTVLLLWYVGDGCYQDNYGNRYITIALSNEEGNEEKIDNYFTRMGLSPASRWRHSCASRYSAVWTVAESKALFDYMAQSPLMDDGPPSGFEYKFPEEYGGTGTSMADVDPWQPTAKTVPA